MKTHEIVKITKAEEAFTASTIVVVLLLLPLWSAKAMMVGSLVSLIVYAILFRDLLRKRGWMAVALPTIAAAVVAVGLAVALSRL